MDSEIFIKGNCNAKTWVTESHVLRAAGSLATGTIENLCRTDLAILIAAIAPPQANQLQDVDRIY
jgi:hypothetical protein